MYKEATIYFNEIEPFAAQWLGNLFPGSTIDERSIANVPSEDVSNHERCHFFGGIGGWEYALQLAGWRGPVWTGSCPCQPLSSAGRQQGSKDERHLWPEFYRLISEQNPVAIFGEQVASKQGRIWTDAVGLDLEELGYAFDAKIMRASCHGADHDRRRVFWFAANSACQRQPKQRVDQQNTIDNQTCSFGEANRFVDAVRREALPFLCSSHDGVPEMVARKILTGYGNAIVPQVAAVFIQAAMEAINESLR